MPWNGSKKREEVTRDLSSGGSYQTASPEQKNIEQGFPVGPSQGVQPQGQPVQDQPVPGIQHHYEPDLQMQLKAGDPLWNVPSAPKVEQVFGRWMCT